ncbi:MAG TPA: KOW domain-containing RNA-binding protein [Feifaniaceae bacterium]|nr:KOW domain-containing RNA-binding protein [Feifaniaceae bacterium]
MNQGGMELLGRVAVSTAGRDRRRTFLVVGLSGEGYVLLCDGDLRKMEHPKKKKLRHVRIEPAVAEDVRSRLLEGANVQDAEIRKSISSLGYGLE